MIELKGITWNHTRGYLPMVATAQRYSELHPDVVIHWEKRSLQHFADFHLDNLAERYDLLVIDHPFIGMAVEKEILLPLDSHLDAVFLADQASHSVGQSHASYCMNGRQWALAIDAATPVSGCRPDMLAARGLAVPGTWGELMALARMGLVAVPAIPLDSLMHFYMLCCGLGEEPFSNPDGECVSEPVGRHALEMLRELYALIDPACATLNPIAIWNLLAQEDTAAYCPFAYGYSNYSRAGYGRHVIEAGGLIALEGRARVRSTLGGAGLALSSHCGQLEAALDYSRFVADPACQSTLYFKSGGQPGHRAAWLDDEVNRESRGFFRNTLATLDQAWLRPRWNGYLNFQALAAELVHRCLWSERHAEDGMSRLNELARQALQSSVTRSCE